MERHWILLREVPTGAFSEYNDRVVLSGLLNSAPADGVDVLGDFDKRAAISCAENELRTGS